jgi:hypothetical protein
MAIVRASTPGFSPTGDAIATDQWNSFRKGIVSVDKAKELIRKSVAVDLEALDSHATFVAVVPPDSLPVRGESLLGYDLLFVQDGIGSLSLRQRRALGDWIHGGGRLILTTPQSALTETRSFLARLIPELEMTPVDSISLFAIGSGRILTLPADYKPPVIPIGDLPEQLQAEVRGQTTLLPGQRIFYASEHIRLLDWIWNSDPSPNTRFLPHNSKTGIPTLPWEALVPLGSKALPVNMIIGAMIVFLLVAGPLEYHVLGLVRRRSLTWLVYPSVAVCSAYVIVAGSNRRLGAGVSGSWDEYRIGVDDNLVGHTTHKLHVAGKYGTVRLNLERAHFHEWNGFDSELVPFLRGPKRDFGSSSASRLI